MIKRQVAWDVRVWNLTSSGTDNSQTRQQMLDFAAEHYPASEGWEAVQVVSPGYETGRVNIAVFFAKYEYVGDDGKVVKFNAK